VTTLYVSSYRAWTPRFGSPVVTSLTRPKWLPEAADWPSLWPVTPRWAYFRAGPAEYERAYLAQLDRHGAKRIAEHLAGITRATGASRLVLLCWEADPGRCHRSLFSTWWLYATGEAIEEVTPCPSK
jgi:hypothetical protein